ncbi:MAG: hypothetical protein R2778_03595 [Saprospiraceae bacterium]
MFFAYEKTEKAEARIPTQVGQFRMIAYADKATERMPHVALVAEGFDPNKPVPVRIHSECMTGRRIWFTAL